MCRHSLFSLVGLLLVLTPLPVQAAGFRALSFQEFPSGVYTAVVLNETPAPLPFSPSKLESAVDASPVHTWWTWTSSDSLEPGNSGLFRFALKRAKSRQDSVNAYFGTDEPMALRRQDLDLLPIHMVREPSSGTLYLYLRNRGDEEASVSRVTMGDVPLTRTAPGSLAIAPGKVGLWIAKPAPWDSQPAGKDVTLEIEVDGSSAYAAARIFDASDYRILWEHEMPDCLVCPTHQLGPWDGVGRRIFSSQLAMPSQPSSVHFCRNRLPDGLAAFGQCTPRAIANLQASNLTRGQPNPWPGWFDIATIVKSAMEPGIFTALVEDASLYSGTYGQPASPEDPPLSITELRPLLYLTLAAGSKGLLLRPSSLESPTARDPHDGSAAVHGPPDAGNRDRFDAPLTELRELLPWLSVSEPAPHAATTSDPDTRLLALLCGDKGMLVVAYRTAGDYPHPLEVTLEVPPGSPALVRWSEPGSLAYTQLPNPGNRLTITLEMKSQLMLLLFEPQLPTAAE